MFADYFYIQETLHKKVIGRGKAVHGLYILDEYNDTAHTLAVTTTTWHSRLGHLSNKHLALLRNTISCNVHDINKDFPCYICPLAKQKKLSFPKNVTFANEKFDLLHCDTWGPYHIKSHSQHQYFLTLVDYKTRFTWIYLMKHKSDVTHIIPQFLSYVKTQFHCV